MPNILGVCKLKPVRPWESTHGSNINVPLPNQLLGMELEMEGWDDRDQAFTGFNFTDDGSLRNNGVEAVSSPIANKYVGNLLTAFFKHFKVTEDNYSERCSLHVHMDMQQRNTEELTTLLLIYQTVERLLFKFIGHDREDSIFCVPWFQSGVSFRLAEQLIDGGVYYPARQWQKYSALNIQPLTTQGTIEFRHLHGTCDVKLIVSWINLLCRMIDFAGRCSLADAKQQIKEMNTISNYRQWLENIFQEDTHLLLNVINYNLELERGVIDSKRMLIEREKNPLLAKSVRPAYIDDLTNQAEQQIIAHEIQTVPDRLHLAPTPRLRRPAPARFIEPPAAPPLGAQAPAFGLAPWAVNYQPNATAPDAQLRVRVMPIYNPLTDEFLYEEQN